MGLPIDICMVCGDVIPEGRQICRKCEYEHYYPHDCIYIYKNYCLKNNEECCGHKCDMYEKGAEK